MDLDELDRRAVAAGWTLDTTDRHRLIAYVAGLGATEVEIASAIDTFNLGDLALEVMLRDGPGRPFADAAADAGLDLEDAARLWRALGFPDPVANPTLVGDDVSRAVGLMWAGRDLVGEDATLALARVVGGATSRMAQAIVDAFRVQFETPQLAAGRSYPDVVEDYTTIARDVLPAFVDTVGVMLVRHLVAASRAAWSTGAEGRSAQQDLAVGFADMVGYTALARSLDSHELTQLIAAFEGAVTDAASHHGGRVIKLVGDGAMFSAGSAVDACSVGAAILETARGDARLPEIRVGLAAGPAVNLNGDLFGATVNLAARLVAMAPEGGVLVSDEVARRAGASVTFEPMPPADLKGIGGPTQAYRVVT